MNVYRGRYRRQVGGNIFGNGFRQAIPLIFRQILKILKPRLISVGKEVGKSVLKAGIGAAGNLVGNNFSTPKESITQPFASEINQLKRKYLPELSEQSGAGIKRRKVINRRQGKKRATIKKMVKRKQGYKQKRGKRNIKGVFKKQRAKKRRSKKTTKKRINKVKRKPKTKAIDIFS